MNPSTTTQYYRVTAYVLRVLTDANEKDWELDFFIEVELLNRMTLWLCKQQDTATGAFVESAPLYDRKLWVRDGKTSTLRLFNSVR